MSTNSPTEDFWAWWAEAAPQIDQAIAQGSVQEWSDQVTERVHAIDDALAWELAPGVEARHQLVVTAEGNPERRATARRWLRRAPAPDGTWEYADARQRVVSLDDLRLTMDGQEISLAEVVVVATRVGNHYDVVVHHPVFSAPPTDSDKTVTFIALDAALGELEVETWLGSVEAAPAAPTDAVPLPHLRTLVEDLAREHLGEGPSWALLQGETAQGPVIAAARVPLASAAAPHLDQHVSVRIGYADQTETGQTEIGQTEMGQTETGLPTPEMLESLRILEDHLAERLAASGELIAHETCDGVRELHFYVDSQTPAESMVQAAIADWPHGSVEVTGQPDPAWAAVGHLRT